jgi:hypothetical protein
MFAVLGLRALVGLLLRGCESFLLGGFDMKRNHHNIWEARILVRVRREVEMRPYGVTELAGLTDEFWECARFGVRSSFWG